MSYKRNKIEDSTALKTLRLSPSSINTFFQCPSKWHANYIEALVTKDSIPLLKGNIVHNVLENMMKLRYIPSGEEFRKEMMKTSLKMLDNCWTKNVEYQEQLKNIQPTKEELELAIEETELMIKHFFTKFCNNIQEGIKFKKYDSERQGYYFTRPIFKELWLDDQHEIKIDSKNKKIGEDKANLFKDTLNVGGFIDSVQKNFDNEVILVDYKTSNKYKNALSSDYVRQLSIYAYLWYKQTNRIPSYVCINYLKFSESYFIKVNSNLIKTAIEDIKLVRNKINEYGLKEDNYPKKEGKLCDYCVKKDRCFGVENEKN